MNPACTVMLSAKNSTKKRFDLTDGGGTPLLPKYKGLFYISHKSLPLGCYIKFKLNVLNSRTLIQITHHMFACFNDKFLISNLLVEKP